MNALKLCNYIVYINKIRAGKMLANGMPFANILLDRQPYLKETSHGRCILALSFTAFHAICNWMWLPSNYCIMKCYMDCPITFVFFLN